VVLEEAVSAANADETGATAIPTLNARALKNRVVFFIRRNLFKLCGGDRFCHLAGES
jgi:hypothetical protein